MTETELANRVEKLERDNRRLKGSALATLVLAAALAAIYATRPVPDKITAHEFDVVDSAGNVRAALMIEGQLPSSVRGLLQSKSGLTVTAPVPELWMRTSFTWHGQPETANLSIEPPDLMMSATPRTGPPVNLASLTAQGLLVWGPDANVHVAGPQGNSGVRMSVSSNGAPAITLSDSQGFSMELGSAATVIPTTGQTQHTSAASIVMFGNDKDHHVIWQAP